MTPEILAEHLGRMAMRVLEHERVTVTRMETRDAWVVTRLSTGERYYVDGMVVYHMSKDKGLQSIYEQVSQEQRGWLLFEGWAPKPRMRKLEKMTPPEWLAHIPVRNRKFVQEYPPQ